MKLRKILWIPKIFSNIFTNGANYTSSSHDNLRYQYHFIHMKLAVLLTLICIFFLFRMFHLDLFIHQLIPVFELQLFNVSGFCCFYNIFGGEYLKKSYFVSYVWCLFIIS